MKTNGVEHQSSQAGPGNSVRAHLLRKAKDCDEARKLYTARLGEAEGNDVFKYLVVLNWIECQSYVAETQVQAHQSFRWSTGAAVAGFLLVGATVSAMIAGPMLYKDVKIEFTTISSISALMTTFISGVFFYLYRHSLRRMDQFHTQLRETQKIVVSLFLNGLSGDVAQANDERKELIHFLIRDEPAHDKTNGSAQAGFT